MLKCQEATFLHRLVTPGDIPDESCSHHRQIATHVSQVSLNYYTVCECATATKPWPEGRLRAGPACVKVQRPLLCPRCSASFGFRAFMDASEERCARAPSHNHAGRYYRETKFPESKCSR